MNISQNEVNDICRKALSDLQLPGGCQQFVQNIVAGNLSKIYIKSAVAAVLFLYF